MSCCKTTFQSSKKKQKIQPICTSKGLRRIMEYGKNKKIEKLLVTYQNKSVFTGCGVAFSHLYDNSFTRYCAFNGTCNTSPGSMKIDENVLFDVASLTKPLVTVLSLLALVQEGKLDLEERIYTYLPFIPVGDKRNIRLLDLIRHTSGLPSHRPYFEVLSKKNASHNMEQVVRLILKEQLQNRPGCKYVYSDLDYMLLGYIIAFVSGETIASYWRRKICQPLNLSDCFYLYNENERSMKERGFVETGQCPWSAAVLRGHVHDDNCRAIGMICGHTGLFATLGGVVALCEDILLTFLGKKDNPSYRREDLMFLLTKREEYHWAYGFDIPTGTMPSCGSRFSANTIGHLGFTGTSFWVDLEKKYVAVLLTNRVIYGEDTKNIREMRPAVHDALVGFFEEKG
jgi:CubicO group peptidase (beta-lactamase class C family)